MSMEGCLSLRAVREGSNDPNVLMHLILSGDDTVIRFRLALRVAENWQDQNETNNSTTTEPATFQR